MMLPDRLLLPIAYKAGRKFTATLLFPVMVVLLLAVLNTELPLRYMSPCKSPTWPVPVKDKLRDEVLLPKVRPDPNSVNRSAPAPP